LYNKIMKLKQKMNVKVAQKIFLNSAQDRQDDIFRKMSADKKIKLGADLWLLAKELSGDKINYGTNRPKTPSRKSL